MEEKQKRTANTTNKPKSSTNKTQAKKQAKTQSKSNSANKKQESNIENKKTAKTTKKEPTATKKKKDPKIDQVPTLTVIHDKKEEKPDVPSVKKEVSKITQTQKTKKETRKQEEKNVEKNKKTKAEKIKEKKIEEQVNLQTSNEEKQQDKPVEKQKKKKKQYIDITIGSILAVVIIIALIILNIKLVKSAYDVMNSTDTESGQSSSTKEIGHELEKDNELVQSIIEKITFAPSVTASIYDTGKFEENNIPNTLKLRIGWNLVKGESKLQSVNENNEIVESIEQKVMEQSIKSIFGSNAEYKDEQFYNTNVSLFSTYAPNKGMIYYENGFYTNSYTKEDEIKLAPFIYQEVQKVVKYSSEIAVYVKVGYIDMLGDVCMIYKDLENGKLSRRILQIDVKELLGETSVNYSTGEGTISTNENTALDTIRNKLNTYKYTLRLDETTGEYYLSSFEQE